jgi:hypothetical protein
VMPFATPAAKDGTAILALTWFAKNQSLTDFARRNHRRFRLRGGHVSLLNSVPSAKYPTPLKKVFR